MRKQGSEEVRKQESEEARKQGSKQEEETVTHRREYKLREWSQTNDSKP
jgi:hypothetical protein